MNSLKLMRKIGTFIILIGSILMGFSLKSQSDSLWFQKPQITFSGFVDVFYVYDFNQPAGNSRQPFLFNHNRHNEFNINLGLLKLSLEAPKYRANLALQTGTYANDNYASEPGILKNINEANIGISLNEKNNLWIDVGVLPAHIGFESALSTDNLTLTRSLAAENSPYFLTGSKVTYNLNDHWEFAALIVNGWQRIQRLQGNSLLSFGTQVLFKPKEGLTLNWSTFIGTDDPDTERRMRYFSNLYGIIQLTRRCEMILGFDIGWQQAQRSDSSYDLWFAPTFITQYALSDKCKTAFRMEYYQDNAGVIIPLDFDNGFQTLGLSCNIDYEPSKILKCRLEGRWLYNSNGIFESREGPTSNNFILGASIALSFSELYSNISE